MQKNMRRLSLFWQGFFWIAKSWKNESIFLTLWAVPTWRTIRKIRL